MECFSRQAISFNRVLMPTRWLCFSSTRHSFYRRIICIDKLGSSLGYINRYVQTTAQPKIKQRNTQRSKATKYSSFHWQYSPNHEPFGYVLNYLFEPYHVLHLKYKRIYEQRRKDTLWWTVITGITTAPKSAVRNYCTRKLKAAFEKALQSRGFDRDGRIPASEEYPDGRDGIIGTVRFTCVKPMITIDPFSLETECLALLDIVIDLSERAQRQKSRKSRLT